MINLEHILDTYSLEEILELNDLTEEDVLSLLLNQGIVTLPEPLPIDIEV